MALSQLTEADFNDQFDHGKREIPDTPLLKEQVKFSATQMLQIPAEREGGRK